MINGLYSDKLYAYMNELLDDFILSDYKEDEIYNELKFMNESIRIGLYLISLNKEFIYLSKRIDSVNRRINDERKEKFIEAFNDGTVDKFLATLGKGDKISLLNDLGLEVPASKRKSMSKTEIDYYNVIVNSIKNSQEDDKRNGLDSFLRYRKDKA